MKGEMKMMESLIAGLTGAEITALVVAGVLLLLLIRRMGGATPFTTRLCKTCREIINDRAMVCPHCHAETGRK
jgi:hypothetical protein